MTRTRRMHSSRALIPTGLIPAGLIPAGFTKFTAENREPWTDAEEDFLLASVDWCLERNIHFSKARLNILQPHSTRELSANTVRAKLSNLVHVRSKHGNGKTLVTRGSTMLHLPEERKRSIQGWFTFIDANYSYMKPPKPTSPVAQPHHSSFEEIRDEAELIQNHLQLSHQDSDLYNSVSEKPQADFGASVDNEVTQDNIVVPEAVLHNAQEKNHARSSNLVDKQADPSIFVSPQNAISYPSSPIASEKGNVSQKSASAAVPISLRAETPVPLPPIPVKHNSQTQPQSRPLSGHSELSERSKRHCKALSGQARTKRTSPSASSRPKASAVGVAPVPTPMTLDTTGLIDFGIDLPVFKSPNPRLSASSPLNKKSSTVTQAVAVRSSTTRAKSSPKVTRSKAQPPTSLPSEPPQRPNNDNVSDVEAFNPFGLRYPDVPESCNEPNWEEMFYQEHKLRMELNHLVHNRFPRTRAETVKEFDSLRSRIKTLSLLICALKNGITPQSLLHRPEDHGELMYKCIQRVAGDDPETQLRLSMDDGVQSYELLSALMMVAIFEKIIQPVISVLFAPPDDLALSYREVYLEQCGVSGLDKMDFLCFWRFIQKPRFRNTIIPEKIRQLRKDFIKALGGLLPGNSSAKAVERSPEEREILDELDRVLYLAVDIKLALSLYLESFHFHFFQPGERFDPLYMNVSGGRLGKSSTASVKLCLSPVMFKATQSETEGTDYDLLAPNGFLPFNRAIRVTMNGDDFSKYAKALEAVVAL